MRVFCAITVAAITAFASPVFAACGSMAQPVPSDRTTAETPVVLPDQVGT